MSGRVVHIQSAIETLDPLAETRWLEVPANKYGLPNAIVGKLDSSGRA